VSSAIQVLRAPNGIDFGEASAAVVNSRRHIFLFPRVKPVLIEYDPTGDTFMRKVAPSPLQSIGVCR
jgi:hypothetical protein